MYEVDSEALNRLVGGAHGDPHGILGAHPAGTETVIRTPRPHATTVNVIIDGVRTPLLRIHDGGVFAGVVDGPPQDYRLEVSYGEQTDIVDDPYRWLPTLGEVDLHLISEGRH